MPKLLKDLQQSYSVIYAVTTEFNERNTPKPDRALWEQIKQMAVAGKKILALIHANNPIKNIPEPTVSAKATRKQSQPLSSSAAATPAQTPTGPSTR